MLSTTQAHLAEWGLERRLRGQYQPVPATEPPIGAPIDASKPLLSRQSSRRWSEPHPGLIAPYYDSFDNSANVPIPAVHRNLAVKTDDDTCTSTSATEHTRLLVGVAYGCISGSLSGMCLLFAKTGVELLIVTVFGNNQFGKWQTWIIVLLLLLTALLQVSQHHSLLLSEAKET
jgi:hypothetical protein